MAIQFKEEVVRELKHIFESCRQRHFGAGPGNKDYYVKNSWSYIKFNILIHYDYYFSVSSIVILVSDSSSESSIMRTIYLGPVTTMLDDYGSLDLLRKTVDACSMELKTGWGKK